MRIKFSTVNPLPKNDFWYVIENKPTKYSISDLQEDINKVVPLVKKPKKLVLAIDNFCLLPNATVNGLVRDGDTITIHRTDKKERKEEKVCKTEATKSTKKRKRKESDTGQPPTSITKKKRTIIKSKPAHVSGKDTKNTSKESTSTIAAPISKTQRRNQRRKLLRKSKKLKEDNQVAAPSAQKPGASDDTTRKEVAISVDKPQAKKEPPTVSNDDVEPRHLVKKNKNKKKNFLKQMENSKRSHITFDEKPLDNSTVIASSEQEQQQQQYDTQNYDENNFDYAYGYEEIGTAVAAEQQSALEANAYGGAFITDSGAQFHSGNNKTNKRKRNNDAPYMKRQYPVDESSSIFYASLENEEQQQQHQEDEKEKESSSDDSSSSSDDSSSSSSSSDDSDDSSASDGDTDESLEVAARGKQTETIEEEKLDYETLPSLSFLGPDAPKPDDIIAFKALQLSETYTPEISDWKKGRVQLLTGSEIVVDILDQNVPQSTRQGYRKFDLPVEDDLETEQEEDTTQHFPYADVFDLRLVSSTSS